MNATTRSSEAPVLLYDGACGVCNTAVRAILRFDRRGTLCFAALDSDFARDVVARHPELVGIDSAVYVQDAGQPSERVHVRSAALLRVAVYLGGWWRLALAGYAIPPRLRDWLYERFAAARYRVAGRYDACPIPSPEVRRRFIGAASSN